MGRIAMPPYFAAVALASTLVCGSLVVAQSAVHEPSRIASEATQSAEEEPEAEAPRRPAKDQSIGFRRLSHSVEVEGTTLSRKSIRHRLRTFRRTIRRFEKTGYEIGVYLCDLDGGQAVCYAADEAFHPASTIKGPYVACVFERLVDEGRIDAEAARQLASSIIVNSDNEAYDALWELSGKELFASWAVDTGAIEPDTETYRDYIRLHYPKTTPRQLATLWKRTFSYLSQPSDSARFLLDQFERRVESPIRDGLGSRANTITKAGWYPSDSGKIYEATADAGIVIANGHTYVMVIMTNMPDNLPELTTYVRGIWSARKVLR